MSLHVRACADSEALRLLATRSLVGGLDVFVPATSARRASFAAAGAADGSAERGAKRARAGPASSAASPPLPSPAPRAFYRARGPLARLLAPDFADRYIRGGNLVFVSRDGDRPLHAGCAREPTPSAPADPERNVAALDASGLLLLRVDAPTYTALGLTGRPCAGPANSAARGGKWKHRSAGRADVTVTDGGPYVISINVLRPSFRPGDAEYERVQQMLASSRTEPVSLLVAWAPSAQASDLPGSDQGAPNSPDSDAIVFPPEFVASRELCAVVARSLVNGSGAAAVERLALPAVERIALALAATAPAPAPPAAGGSVGAGVHAERVDALRDAADSLEAMYCWLGLVHALPHLPLRTTHRGLVAAGGEAAKAGAAVVDGAALERMRQIVCPHLPCLPRGGASQLVGEGWRTDGLLPPAWLARQLRAARALVDGGGAPWVSLALWGLADASLDPSRRVPTTSSDAERTGASAPAGGRAETDLLVLLLPASKALLFSAHALGQRAAWLSGVPHLAS
ncbi:hypothetical protein T492DRAFT_901990 [Pavlovales sp. CCMP2436]|nr:hypothetical protein T492DRAFT_901990 [Pavlovales sp. CCMP2436]